MKYNPKHIIFVDEYMKHRDRARAYSVAYKNDNLASCSVLACKLLKNVNVAHLMNDRLEILKERANISQEKVLAEYYKIAFLDTRDAYGKDGQLKKICDLPADVAAAVAGIESDDINIGVGANAVKIGETKKLKFHSKIQALDSIRDTLGFKAPTQVIQNGTLTWHEEKTYEQPKEKEIDEIN